MILLIDSYDSFTNNLSQLVSETTGKKVVTIHNDAFPISQYDHFLANILPSFDYIVIGPGPGHPSIATDVGIISWLLQQFKTNPAIPKYSIPPILGICLGFQSICFEFDNEVERLEHIKHGQVYDVVPIEVNELFKSVEPFPSVRYHSLYVDIDHLSEDIVPLAYCWDKEQKVLMAAKHSKLPFYGVQYHPESICSQKGKELIENFNAIAEAHNEKTDRRSSVASPGSELPFLTSAIASPTSSPSYGLFPSGKLNSVRRSTTNLYHKKFKMPSEITSVGVCNYLIHKNGMSDDSAAPVILLNSASLPGEWSIIGLPTQGKSEVITHSIDNKDSVQLATYGSVMDQSSLQLQGKSVWSYVAEKFEEKFISRASFTPAPTSIHEREIPFLGGYLGLISYEEGQHIVVDKLESITKTDSKTPDLKLVYIERFIIYDHVTHDWIIVSINQDANDTEWCNELYNELNQARDSHSDLIVVDQTSVAKSVKDLLSKDDSNDTISIEFPSRDIYNDQFQKCQDLLHSGDSYELCLTTQSKIRIPAHIRAWEIYKILTIQKNPSPFSCFMEFDDLVLISSSPERFLSWKDEEHRKIVELRPIKGTVRKSDVMTREKATLILKTPKEMGENLMIVDLIRHDLHKFIEKVSVDQLMSVEEYKTVYQLVSVIRGELGQESPFNGLDILHESLPPGSMTGAPKKRSVELLQDIEAMQPTSVSGGRRGIYSGVVGYWSVTDDSDWSVIIRSVFHYRKDKENDEKVNLWRIGAGGAITVLSEVDSEWEEMEVKLSSALQAFR